MFKEPIESWLSSSIIARAERQGIISVHIESILRDVEFDHHAIDDAPYGGGPGELMRINVIAPLIEKTLNKDRVRTRKKKRVLLMDPAGLLFSQKDAQRLSQYEELIFISGRYEGIDARVHHFVDEAISIGDYVTTSGDLPAMVILDATARMVPGVLGNHGSIVDESHFSGRLEGSHYTRPASYDSLTVPEIFQSGNHSGIAQAKALESLHKTMHIRPDLLEKFPLTQKEAELLARTFDQLHYPWMAWHE
jgi:tRNA (guanine37-N1)-methyltransferase